MLVTRAFCRWLALTGLVALVACQTVPEDGATSVDETPEQVEETVATKPLEPTEPKEQTTEEMHADYSPVMVFLADFEPQSDWVEVVLDEEKTLYLQPEPSFTRDDLLSVETYASESGDGLLALVLTEPASERLANLTRAEPERRLALAVDGTLLAVPRYSEPLTNGQLVFMVGSIDNAQTAARIIAGDEATEVSPEHELH